MATVSEAYLWVVVVGIIACFCMSFCIGANDVANNFSTSVGSKALSLWLAVCLAALLETLGATLLGGAVTDAVRSQIIDFNEFADYPSVLMLGMLCSLLGAGMWLYIATRAGLPVSTTHSIIGALLGFGLASGNIKSIKWEKIAIIVGSWLIAPISAALMGGSIFVILRKFILRNKNLSFKRSIRFLWLLIFFICISFSFFLVFKNPFVVQTECLQELPSGEVHHAYPCMLSRWSNANAGLASAISVGVASVLAFFLSIVIYKLAFYRVKKYEQKLVKKQQMSCSLDSLELPVTSPQTPVPALSGGMNDLSIQYSSSSSSSTTICHHVPSTNESSEHIHLSSSIENHDALDMQKYQAEVSEYTHKQEGEGREGREVGGDDQRREKEVEGEENKEIKLLLHSNNNNNNNNNNSNNNNNNNNDIESNMPSYCKNEKHNNLLLQHNACNNRDDLSQMNVEHSFPSHHPLHHKHISSSSSASSSSSSPSSSSPSSSFPSSRHLPFTSIERLKDSAKEKWRNMPWFKNLHEESCEEDMLVHKLNSEAEVFEPKTELFFSACQVLAACLGCIAHSANDTANSIGPLAAILTIYYKGLDSECNVEWYILLFGGLSMSLGLALLGYRVIKTVGTKLVKITPCRGFSIDLGAAWVVLIFSSFGVPLSTTHCAVGSTLGVGLMEKKHEKNDYEDEYSSCCPPKIPFLNTSSVNWKLFGGIFVSWIGTVAFSAGVSMVLFAFAAYSPSLNRP